MTVDGVLTAMLFGKDQRMLYDLARGIREATQVLGAQTPRMAVATTDADLRGAFDSDELWDIACVDIGQASEMSGVYQIRAQVPSVELFLAVDARLSPMVYIKPGVMPAGLVQKPASDATVRNVMKEFVAYVLQKREDTSASDAFSIQTKEGVTKLPMHTILCFESRSKRIFVRQQRQEYCYYDTLDRLEKSLAPFFIRCHRSFIVNTQRIAHVRLSRGQIEMDDGSIIPVSRSYKAAIKEQLV